MKRIMSMLLCILLISSCLTLPVNAAENSNVNEQIIVSQTIEYVGNDCYYIETIYVPSVQPYDAYTKTGTKTAAYVVAGTTIYSVSVTGTFYFDGSTSNAMSASGSVATYVENATIKSCDAHTSGNSAVATGSVVYLGFTLQKTVTLSCDKDGNLS